MFSLMLAESPTISYMTMPEPERTRSGSPWGWHLVLNLYDCEHEQITSYDAIKEYVIELCDLIDMRRFGEPTIVNFGDDPKVAGYSLVQLIETSNVCAHFANESNSAYFDIFSCKKFDPEAAARFTIAAFGAQKATGAFLSRE